MEPYHDHLNTSFQQALFTLDGLRQKSNTDSFLKRQNPVPAPYPISNDVFQDPIELPEDTQMVLGDYTISAPISTKPELYGPYLHPHGLVHLPLHHTNLNKAYTSASRIGDRQTHPSTGEVKYRRGYTVVPTMNLNISETISSSSSYTYHPSTYSPRLVTIDREWDYNFTSSLIHEDNKTFYNAQSPLGPTETSAWVWRVNVEV